MYQGATMSFGDSLMISTMGLATVFICLIALCLAIMLFSKIFSTVGREKPIPVVAPAGPPLDEETYAVLLGAVSEETRLPLDQFRITKIDPLP